MAKITSRIPFDASFSPLSNAKNHRSLTCSYQKLLKKYSGVFYFEMDNSGIFCAHCHFLVVTIAYQYYSTLMYQQAADLGDYFQLFERLQSIKLPSFSQFILKPSTDALKTQCASSKCLHHFCLQVQKIRFPCSKVVVWIEHRLFDFLQASNASLSLDNGKVLREEALHQFFRFSTRFFRD